MSSTKAVAAAVAAAINGSLPGSVEAYRTDKVPAPLPSEYVEVTISRRLGGTQRTDGTCDVTGWRLSTRPVSATSINNAELYEDACRSALEGVVLVIDGIDTTPIEFETGDEIEKDEQRWTGRHYWTFLH